MVRGNSNARTIQPLPPYRLAGLSETLKQWVVSPSRPSIWMLHDDEERAVQMSETFRQVMRPMFRKIFWIGFEENSSHGSLLLDTEVNTWGSFVASDGRRGDKTVDVIEGMKCDIRSLRDIVDLVVASEPPPAHPHQPANHINIVKNFLKMCNAALKEEGFEKLRMYVYFITKNVIIYDMTEELVFLDKMWHVYKANQTDFKSDIKLKKLNGYITLENVEKDSPFYPLLFDAIGDFQPYYTFGHSALHFYFNCKRHVQESSNYWPMTASDIHQEMLRLIPCFVAELFDEIARVYGFSNRVNPLDRNIITIFEAHPYILWPTTLIHLRELAY
ncbi:unnamed protein product [Cuscuta campestris]|uniref:Uncharacterized protein n=1 Tax=Cuscuta campestris TaxID=132261 RepID=A0A484MSU2_9ASTE|nr:unnamed protein product [Cuscuta campestris]